jgi:hypothetical protein
MQSTEQTAPGLAETAAAVAAARPAAESKAAAQQAEAKTFIQEHGAAALGGYTVTAAERY